MFNSLKGTVSQKNAVSVHLQTDFIEWDLLAPGSTLDSLPQVGDTVRLFTYLHHREDQLALYGFASREERNLFLDLLKVGGIGPRQALKILSGMSVEEFVGSLNSDDVDGLSRVPGLGKKTACIWSALRNLHRSRWGILLMWKFRK